MTKTFIQRSTDALTLVGSDFVWRVYGSQAIEQRHLATGISIQSAGSGGAHNNVQPTLICNWIVKA